MFSAKLHIIFKFRIYTVKSLVFTLKSGNLSPSLLYLIDSDSKYIFSLSNIFADIIIFHDLVLGCSLIM